MAKKTRPELEALQNLVTHTTDKITDWGFEGTEPAVSLLVMLRLVGAGDDFLDYLVDEDNDHDVQLTRNDLRGFKRVKDQLLHSAYHSRRAATMLEQWLGRTGLASEWTKDNPLAKRYEEHTRPHLQPVN